MSAQTAFSRLRYRPAAIIAVGDLSSGLRYWFLFPFGIEESEMFFQKLKVNRNPQKFIMVINRSEIYQSMRYI